MNEDEPSKLEGAADTLRHYAKVLRGEELDLTGLGIRRILLDQLEDALGCRIISQNQYENYKELSEADFKRRGGLTSS